jgi:hypothetical protein
MVNQIPSLAITRELEQSRTKLEELMSMNADMREIRAVTNNMNELLYREEMMWMQKSRIDWLWEGDKNTIFFIARQCGEQGKIAKKKTS